MLFQGLCGRGPGGVCVTGPGAAAVAGRMHGSGRSLSSASQISVEGAGVEVGVRMAAVVSRGESRSGSKDGIGIESRSGFRELEQEWVSGVDSGFGAGLGMGRSRSESGSKCK